MAELGDIHGHWRGTEGRVLWRLASVLRGHEEQVRHVVFSPDGAFLAAASLDGTIRVWKVAEATLVRTLRDEESPRPALGIVLPPRISFSPDGTLLAASIGNGLVRIYDEHGARVATLTADAWYATDVTFSPSGKHLVTGDRDGKVTFWDIESRSRIWQFEASSRTSLEVQVASHPAIRSLVFSPNGRYLLIVSETAHGMVHLRRIDEGTLSSDWIGAVVEHGHGPSEPTFSSDGSLFAVGIYDETCSRMFETTTLREVSSFCPPDDIPVGVSFAPNGHLLAVAGGRRGIVWMWDAEYLEVVGRIASHSDGWGKGSPAWKIGAVAFSRAGNHLAVAGMDIPEGASTEERYHGPVDWTVKIWDVMVSRI